ncbi:MAG TPA: ArsR family transcriptional regulator [Pirellulales bacterium]|jgi:predicted ArsR family transcriptional regulator|nr:ArsR family transcriptional regulator [Pirellulales bacterium]
MGGISQTSDSDIVGLLRETGSMCVSELAQATDVTPTAVRQRLSRLMSQGIVGRHTLPGGRGRPSHRYVLTEKGQRQSGSNFVDLAMVLWQEIRSISEPAVRRGLIVRLAKRMAGFYADRVQGETARARMQGVAEVFGDRNVPLAVDTVTLPAGHEAAVAKTNEPATGRMANAPAGENPLKVIDLAKTKLPADETCEAEERGPASESAVLTVWACPYPELAEVDRGICAMERLMFAELLAQDVRLTACRLDGDPCCRFQTVPLAVPNPVASG